MDQYPQHLRYFLDLFNSPIHQLLSTKYQVRQLCAKSVVNELYFKCWDCCQLSNHLICKCCFEKANHHYHNIQLQYESKGTCDCGDIQSVTQTCRDHSIKIDYLEIEKMRNQFQTTLKEFQQRINHLLVNLIELMNSEEDKESSIIEHIEIIKFFQNENKFLLDIIAQELINPVVIIKNSNYLCDSFLNFLLSFRYNENEEDHSIINSIENIIYLSFGNENFKKKLCCQFMICYNKLIKINKKQDSDLENVNEFAQYTIYSSYLHSIYWQFTKEYMQLILNDKLNGFLKVNEEINCLKYHIEINSLKKIESQLCLASKILDAKWTKKLFKFELSEKCLGKSKLLQYFKSYISSCCQTQPLKLSNFNNQLQDIDSNYCYQIYIESRQLSIILNTFNLLMNQVRKFGEDEQYIIQEIMNLLMKLMEQRNRYGDQISGDEIDSYIKDNDIRTDPLIINMKFSARFQDLLFFQIIQSIHYSQSSNLLPQIIQTILKGDKNTFLQKIIIRTLKALISYQLLYFKSNINMKFIKIYEKGSWSINKINSYSLDLNILKHSIVLINNPQVVYEAFQFVINFFPIQLHTIIIKIQLDIIIQLLINQIHDINSIATTPCNYISFDSFYHCVLQTIFKIQNNMSFTKILAYSNSIGISTEENLKQMILQQCIFDKDLKTFKMNPANQFEPFLLQQGSQAQQDFIQTFESRSDQSNNEIFLKYFGNNNFSYMNELGQKCKNECNELVQNLVNELNQRMICIEFGIKEKVEIKCILTLLKISQIYGLKPNIGQIIKISPHFNFLQSSISFQSNSLVLKQNNKSNIINRFNLKNLKFTQTQNIQIENENQQIDICQICKLHDHHQLVLPTLIYLNSNNSLAIKSCFHKSHSSCLTSFRNIFQLDECQVCKCCYNFLLPVTDQTQLEFKTDIDYLTAVIVEILQNLENNIDVKQECFQILLNLFQNSIFDQSQTKLIFHFYKYSVLIGLPISNDHIETNNQNQNQTLNTQILYNTLLKCFFFAINQNNFIFKQIIQNNEQLQSIIPKDTASFAHLENIFNIIFNDQVNNRTQITDVGILFTEDKFKQFTSNFKPNFLIQFNDFVESKCSICKELPKSNENQLIQCLFCWQIICMSVCSGKINYLDHLANHGGIGAYLYGNDCKILLCFQNGNAIYQHSLYYDKFGRSVDISVAMDQNPEMQNYTLDAHQLQCVWEIVSKEYQIIDFVYYQMKYNQLRF